MFHLQAMKINYRIFFYLRVFIAKKYQYLFMLILVLMFGRWYHFLKKKFLKNCRKMYLFWDRYFHGATTLSITTSSIMTLSIIRSNATLGINDTQCHIMLNVAFCIVMLSVAFLLLCWVSFGCLFWHHFCLILINWQAYENMSAMHHKTFYRRNLQLGLM